MPDRTEQLASDAVRARDGFVAALARVPQSDLRRPGLVGEWSVQELVAHVGYWAGHAVEVLHAAERGTTELVGVNQPPTDEVNATVARVARHSDVGAVLTRESAAFAALLERLRDLDPQRLDDRVADGATVEASVRGDTVEHYEEHAGELLAATA